MNPNHSTTPFTIPADWTTEQAMAVVDILDELRERIWVKYEVRLIAAYRDCYQPPTISAEYPPPCIDDDLF